MLDPHPQARGTAKNTFTTWQDVAGVASDLSSLPATLGNELRKGTQGHLEARGEFSTTVTPTLQFGFIYNATPAAAGGTILAQNAAVATGSGAAAWPWWAVLDFIVTVINGASSTIYVQGSTKMGTSLTAYGTEVIIPATAAARAVTFDPTIKALWGVGAAWGTSSVSNSITVDMFRADILNQGKTS